MEGRQSGRMTFPGLVIVGEMCRSVEAVQRRCRCCRLARYKMGYIWGAVSRREIKKAGGVGELQASASTGIRKYVGDESMNAHQGCLNCTPGAQMGSEGNVI